jgi:RNA polymerase sigma-70 factor, ECF subfamily
VISTSQSLIHRLRDPSDADAWTRFVHLYTPLLLSWTNRAGLAQADASDVIQDVFTRLLRALPEFTYDPQRSFRGYLNTVVQNCWKDHCRKRKAHLFDTPTGAMSILADAETIPEIEETEYRQTLLRRGLSLVEHEFSTKIWQGFLLTVIEGKSPSEVAQILETTVNAIYLGRARVLRRLREVLQELLD